MLGLMMSGPPLPTPRSIVTRSQKERIPPGKAVANQETELCVALPHKTIHQLRQHAALMGISAAMLAANLLQTIAQDRLYKAVLDTG